MNLNKKIARKILNEYISEIDGIENIAGNTLDQTQYNEPSTYSRSSVGRDFRDKIFDLEHSNTILLRFIDDFNDLLIMNPTEMTTLSQQVKMKLPEIINGLQQLDDATRSQIITRFTARLKTDFFSLYSMVMAEYNGIEHGVAAPSEPEEPIELEAI